MLLLVIATVLIVVAVGSLVTLALAARHYRDWDEPPIKQKRIVWKGRPR